MTSGGVFHILFTMAQNIEHLLTVRGLSVPEVAKILKCTRRWVYEQCATRNLPRNTEIKRNSSLERSILRALIITNMNYETVGRLHSQAARNIKQHVASLRKDSRARVRTAG